MAGSYSVDGWTFKKVIFRKPELAKGSKAVPRAGVLELPWPLLNHCFRSQQHPSLLASFLLPFRFYYLDI